MTLRTPPSHWLQMFLVDDQGESFAEVNQALATPRYNIAPTQNIPAIVRGEASRLRQLKWFRWGLVPAWADSLAIGSKMINARSETVHEKPSFRKALASRRCLVVADGYYEWKTEGKTKQPFLIEHSDGGVFAMAGLWEENRKAMPGEPPIQSCTIITTAGNDLTSDIHDRMPVILASDDFDTWLDPSHQDTESLRSMLVPAANELLRRTPVSKHVGNVRNTDEECSRPIGEAVTWQ